MSVEEDQSTIPHRLPTVSAWRTLQDAKTDKSRTIPLGLKNLDQFLHSADASIPSASDSTGKTAGGLLRGEIMEIYGPPGCGKTTFALQAAVNALYAGGKVIWVDAATKIPGNRLKEIVNNFRNSSNDEKETNLPSSPSEEELLSRFFHYVVPSIPHLIALLIHRAPNFPPLGTSLIVIDGFSHLFDVAYPRHFDVKDSTRIYQRPLALSGLADEFYKLAGVHDVAILFVNHTVTKIGSDGEAAIRPAIVGSGWENVVHARVVLYQDWMNTSSAQNESPANTNPKRSTRLAVVMKNFRIDTLAQDKTDCVFPFKISNSGLVELPVEVAPVNVSPVKTKGDRNRKKRPIDQVNGSEAESLGSSDDSDYGDWEADENLVQLGSEGLVEGSLLSQSQAS